MGFREVPVRAERSVVEAGWVHNHQKKDIRVPMETSRKLREFVFRGYVLVVVKIRAALNTRCRIILGPKRDHNFDNHTWAVLSTCLEDLGS